MHKESFLKSRRSSLRKNLTQPSWTKSFFQLYFQVICYDVRACHFSRGIKYYHVWIFALTGGQHFRILPSPVRQSIKVLSNGKVILCQYLRPAYGKAPSRGKNIFSKNWIHPFFFFIHQKLLKLFFLIKRRVLFDIRKSRVISRNKLTLFFFFRCEKAKWLFYQDWLIKRASPPYLPVPT